MFARPQMDIPSPVRYVDFLSQYGLVGRGERYRPTGRSSFHLFNILRGLVARIVVWAHLGPGELPN